MKNFNLPFVSIFIFLVCLDVEAHSQVSNYIYAINNTAVGVYYFSKIDATTGVITNLSSVPYSISSNASSSFIDDYSKIYYYNSGSTLTGFDAASGSVVSTVPILIAGEGEFLYPAFNPCDSNIYGIVN